MLVWVVVWGVLVLGAGAIFALLGLTLWRKGTALIAEMGAASDKVTAALAALNEVDRPFNDHGSSQH
jgi:hypothetical protein